MLPSYGLNPRRNCAARPRGWALAWTLLSAYSAAHCSRPNAAQAHFRLRKPPPHSEDHNRRGETRSSAEHHEDSITFLKIS